MLQGFYVTEEGTIPLPPDRDVVAIYDAYGAGALFPYRASADSAPDQVGIVHTSQAFESNWDKLATCADF